MINPTNATSPSQICLEVWSGYRGSNYKSTGLPPNTSSSASATASPYEGGTRLTTSPVGGDLDSEASTLRGDTGESPTLGA